MLSINHIQLEIIKKRDNVIQIYHNICIIKTSFGLFVPKLQDKICL